LDITDTLQQTVDDFFQGIYDFVDTKLTGAEEWGDKISQRFTDKIMETPGLNLALVAGTALEALWNTPNSNLSAPFDAAKQAGMDILAQILDGLGAAFLGSDVGAEAEAAGAVGVGSQRGGGLSETLNEMVQGVFDDIDIIDVDWSTLTNPFEELGETVAGWVDIDWPEPPSIPEWIKDPWGWVRSQIKDGSSGENKARVGSGGGGMAEMLMSGVAGDIRNSMQGEGFTFNATFNITDNASAPLATVQAAADAFVGTYTGMLDATDFASTDIANVQAAADDLVGTYTVTINAEDNASDPLSNIASLVASIPDSKTITINTVTTGSPVPRATGGVVREPLTLVGERGPEVLSLPYGSRVHTAGATRGMLGMGGQTMRIDHRLTVDVRGKVDGADEQQLTTKVAQVVAQAWVQAETEAMRGQGL
jgi:hypothetical protein